MRAFFRTGLLLLAIALPGCLRGSTRESDKPETPSTAENVRARIARMGLTANPSTDALAARLEALPLESLGAPGARFLVIATVSDSEGQPRRQKKIEWSLDGVGEIAAVDTGSYLSVLESKPQAKFAVSYTAALPRSIKGEAGEAITLRPGQSWCVLTSDTEGDARLTVHAPEIANPAAREVFVMRRWADVAWTAPAPFAARIGESPVLATQVVRASDRVPAANYRVRYRLVDGPPAVFQPSGASETDIAAVNGQSRVVLIEQSPRAGRSRIAVELIRANPGAPDTEAVVLARNETSVDWQAPQVSLTLDVPPAAVAGQEVPIRFTIANTGQIPTSELALRMPTPDGALIVGSDPSARDDGGQLFWPLANLAPGESQTIRAVFRMPSPAVVQFAAAVWGRDGLSVQQRATTRVATAQLLADLKAPPTAAPGDAVTYDATVINGGNGPATNVVLHAAYDEGLEHESQAHPLEVRIGNLEPGKSRTVPVTLTPRQTGVFRVRLTASADGNLRGAALHTLSVAGKVLNVSLGGPATRYADRTGLWDVRVGNPGTVPITNVMVRIQMPPELECRSVSDKGQYTARQAVWTVGSLLPGEQKNYQVTAAALQLTARTQVTATATGDGVPEQTAIAPLEVLGAPAVRVEIVTPGATAPLKSKVMYRIVVRNAGSLAARNVAVTAELTPNVLRPIAATGPAIGRVAGERVAFDPIDRLDAKQAATFLIEAEGAALGDGRIRVSVKSDHMPHPAQIEESTLVIPALPPPSPASQNRAGGG